MCIAKISKRRVPTIGSGLLDVVGLHAIEGSLSTGRAIEEAGRRDMSAAPVHSPMGAEAIELVELVLGVREELGTLLEALGVGQVCSGQPTSVSQAAR